MKKLVLALVGLLASTLLPSYGATELATFNGFANRLTEGSYTVDLNGNTVGTDGKVTISSPIILTCDSTWNGGTTDDHGSDKGISILLKYSSLAPSSNAALMTTYMSDAGTCGLGCYATSGLLVGGIWQNVVWTGTSSSNTYIGNTAIDASGYLIMTYVYGSYVVVYNGSGTAVYTGNGLQGSNKQIGTPLYIGGSVNNTLVASGMVVEGIAVYQGALASTEIATAVSDYEDFVSKDASVTITENTTVSAINALTEFQDTDTTTLNYRTINVASDVTITLDAALSYAVAFTGSGDLTLSLGSSYTDASSYDFSNFDFSNMSGGVLRSWLTSDDLGVIGFNFNAANASNTASAFATGTWIHDTTGATGSSTALISDGLSELTWSANNVYTTSYGTTASGTNEFIISYLDDSSGVNITMTAIPYASYDVIIYCATDTSGANFSYKTVNGTNYTWDDATGAVVVGTDAWGDADTTKSTGAAAYGVNALRITDLTGNLTISSVRNSTARGCISGIQIVPAGTVEPTLTAGGSDATDISWSTADNWNVDEAPTSGAVAIVLEGDTTLTIDTTVDVGAVSVSGTGTLTIAVGESGSFSAASLQYDGSLILKNTVTIDAFSVSGPVYYDYSPTTIASRENGNYYRAGAGSSSSAVTASLVGGTMGLMSGTYYYNTLADYSASATATTVELSNDAAITIAATTNDSGRCFRVGSATYILSDNSSIETDRFILSDGGAGRTSVFTMSNTSSVVVNGRGSSYNSLDNTSCDIMFGHWNGLSTFTITDSATFTATNSDVLVGRTSNTHVINVEGGTLSVKGIKASANATGSNTLNISGGTIDLGSSGIDSWSTTEIGVNVTANSLINLTSTSTLATPITQDIAFTGDATLTISNATYSAATEEDKAAVATNIVNLAGAVTGSGTIVIGPKVSLGLTSTTRPDSTVTLDMTAADATLSIYLESNAETPSFTILGTDVADRITIYGEDGTVSTTATISVSEESSNVYTISPGLKVFNANDTSVALGTSTQWDNESVATDNEDFEIKLSTDATLDVTSSYTYGTVYVTSTDSQQHTLTISEDFPASKLDLGENVVLVFSGLTDGTTLSNTIRGDGSVTYSSGQTLTLAADNSYTGGTTIETDCVVTLAVDSSGENDPLGYGGTIAGAGQVVITNATFIPTGTSTTPFNVTFTDSAWTGTVTLRGVSRSNSTGAIYLNTLANSASTLELDGVSGYFANEHTATMKELRILKETPVTFDSNEYYGFHVNNGNGQHSATLTGKLTGDGPITLKKTQSGNMPRFCLTLVGDATEWTGNVDMTENSSSTANYFRLSFAASSSYVFTSNTSTYDDYLSISRDVTISTWTLDTSDGKVAVATACNLNVTRNSTITASTMTLADGAQIVVTDTTTDDPATFTAALTVTGTTTITGGSVKATSATYGSSVDTDSIVLASLDSELILDSESEVTVGTTEDLAAENYYVSCSKSSSTYRYFLRKPAFILSIR